MSAVLSIPAERRRATVPARVLAPWVLTIAGCFCMAFGVGHAPGQDAAAPQVMASQAGVLQASVAILPGAGAAADRAEVAAGDRIVRSDAAPSGSPALKSLALLAFVAALAVAVLGTYRGHGLNGD